MDPLTAHRRAQDAFSAVLSQVPADQIRAQTPCSEWTVRDVVAHIVSGNYRIAGSEPPSIPDDLAGLIDAHTRSADVAQSAFAAPGALEKPVKFPFGEVPGAVAVGMRARDALAHAWDLAKATGQPTDIDPELASDMLESSRQTLTPAQRGPGRPFDLEQPCEVGRPPADRFAAFLGRDVS